MSGVRIFPNGFWLLLLLGLLLVTAMALFSPDPTLRGCLHANQRKCPDLLRAQIRFRRHDSKATLTPICGSPRSNACAIRQAHWQRVVCEVHLLDAVGEEVIEHELNHCRGWEHGEDTPESYLQPWTPNWRLIRSRGALGGGVPVRSVELSSGRPR